MHGKAKERQMNSERRAGDEKLLKFPKQKKTQWWDNDWFHLDAERFAFLSHLLDCTHIMQSKVHFVVHAFASTMRGFLCEYKLQLCISFHSCFFCFLSALDSWSCARRFRIFASIKSKTNMNFDKCTRCLFLSIKRSIVFECEIRMDGIESNDLNSTEWKRKKQLDSKSEICSWHFKNSSIERLRERTSETGRQRDCKADYMVASSCG